ncbi:hypothetical protein GTA08_BOTSDO08840 [Botryosphaeria dothidea]|uniref:DUF7918 domain-containing protein n=1 Tax=Botryosphaeria dothidea TaxID=55169 RepID=A0A8H4IM73_9PEZI|nr:hypothetical protein GTA08_BOTSDO08840 [Botryosphaeria dothidea]
MAILTSIPGLDAEVRVDGVHAMEYTNEVEEEDAATTTIRYIESIFGAKFSTHCTCTEAFNHGEEDVFVTFHVDDEDNSELAGDQPETKLRSLGEISLQFYKGKRGGLKRAVSRSSEKVAKKVNKIPEKALKGPAVSHSVGVGEAKPTRPWHTRSFNRKDGGRPFATMTYRYSSKAAVQKEHIIPRTPFSTPLKDRPLETMTPDELREELRRHREDQARRPVIKQEINPAIKQEIKQESFLGQTGIVSLDDEDTDIEAVSVRPRKRQRTTRPAEVIELLDD